MCCMWNLATTPTTKKRREERGKEKLEESFFWAYGYREEEGVSLGKLFLYVWYICISVGCYFSKVLFFG